MESSIPQAAAIWMTLLIVVALSATALIRPGRRPVPGDEHEPVAQPHADVARYAAEIVVAADHAAVTAACRRAEWEQAQEDVDTAWAAYDAADRAARRIAAAAAFPALNGCRRPGENADRERYLHRAATAACRRHEISIKQLNEALAHRGFDPGLHPVAQELALHNAVREHRLAQYQAATTREREAWEAAEVATEALRSLRLEAQAAQVLVRVRTAGEQWWAEQWEATVPLTSTVDGRHPIAA